MRARSQLFDPEDKGHISSEDLRKRQSEEQLFKEVSLLMQERDLLVREKASLQNLLLSASEETGKLFEAEQRHLVEIQKWEQQQVDIVRDKEQLHNQLQEALEVAEKLREIENAAEHEKVRCHHPHSHTHWS